MLINRLGQVHSDSNYARSSVSKSTTSAFRSASLQYISETQKFFYSISKSQNRVDQSYSWYFLI